MQKLKIPYLALVHREGLSWENFQKNCEGLKSNRVLFFTEASDEVESLKSEMMKLPRSEYPSEITMGFERP